MLSFRSGTEAWQLSHSLPHLCLSPEPFWGKSIDFLLHRSAIKSAGRCRTGSSSSRGIREPAHLGEVIRSMSMSREKANEPPRGDTRPGAPTPSAPLKSASCTPVRTKAAIQEGSRTLGLLSFRPPSRRVRLLRCCCFPFFPTSYHWCRW